MNLSIISNAQQMITVLELPKGLKPGIHSGKVKEVYILNLN